MVAVNELVIHIAALNGLISYDEGQIGTLRNNLILQLSTNEHIYGHLGIESVWTKSHCLYECVSISHKWYVWSVFKRLCVPNRLRTTLGL